MGARPRQYRRASCVAFVGSIGPALSAKNVKVAEVFARQA